VGLLKQANANIRLVSLDDVKVGEQIEHIQGDLCDFSFCKEISKDMDYVFHIAGIKGSPKMTLERPASFLVPLLMMNTNMLEASRVNRVPKLIYTSSIGAYAPAEFFKESDLGQEQPPMDHFPGWAKRVAEFQIQSYQIQYELNSYAMVRLCNVYGPGDNFDPANAMVIPALISRIAGGENPLKVMGDGTAVRDFAYSGDVAEGIIRAIHFGTGKSYVNLGSGIGYSIKTLVETLKEVCDFDYEFDSLPSSGFSRRVMDVTLARESIGYNPQMSLKDGLSQTWDWYKANSQEHLSKKNYFKRESESHAN
ncbi:MAG: GDP-L-fucose synthase, partial [Candidatus Omnitrophota bacterium]